MVENLEMELVKTKGAIKPDKLQNVFKKLSIIEAYDMNL